MKNIKEKLGKNIGKFALFVAKTEANSACPYLTYHPKKTESVKN